MARSSYFIVPAYIPIYLETKKNTSGCKHPSAG